jgi:diguanylate cyclase (GGDEF)-like protein
MITSVILIIMKKMKFTGKSSAHVLVLDDEPLLRSLVSKTLESMGHRVAQAENLAAAREIIEQVPIELVLSDISLIGESGLDLLHELDPRSSDIAVVMMTGNSDAQTAIDCLRSGAFDYLLKPMTSQDIIEVVDRVLERQLKMKAERDRIEEQLRVLGRFSSENPNPVMRVDMDGTLLYANGASSGILDELDLGLGAKLPKHLRDLTTRARSEARAADFELENSGRFYSMTVTPIRDAEYVYLYGHDISDLKRAEYDLTCLKDKAQKMALYDGLTGLPNRTFLEDRFSRELAACERNGTKLAVVFLDLDRFKQINDTQGHKAGDQLLASIARHLHDNVRETDTVARWGGDEFVMLLPGIEDLDHARILCERIKAKVQEEIAEKDGFFVTMSMGAAICPDDATDPEQLLQTADAALLLVKTRARNEVIFFGECPGLKSFEQKNTVRTLLCDAVSEDRIQIHYQPVVDASTGAVVGAEALARWNEEGHGWIPPSVFIPLAESMGIVEEMGRKVQVAALGFLKECHTRGEFISLSINVSFRQLLRSDFVVELLDNTQQLGLLPSQITLELTESQTLLGVHSESDRLEELAAAGFSLSIDDFGQGHSSLASLHEMCVEELKIDMQFVRNLHTEKGRHIVKAIEQLARILGLETVAEGVETPEQERILREFGISRLQGFLYSKALPADEFFEFLAAHRAEQSAPVARSYVGAPEASTGRSRVSPSEGLENLDS